MTSAQKDRKAEMQLQSVYYGDCLKHLTHWNNWNRWDENNNARLKMDRKLADLIYLDPPWNSDTYYNITHESADNKAKGNTAQSTVFTDVWKFEDAAEQRLARLTKDYLSPNDPFYPLLRARDCIAGLTQVLGKTGMLAYLTHMAERLAMCRELLKETGSIYLHCDPYASHYLKTLMDAIFGKENYRNDIVWCYHGASNAAKYFPRKHDYILFYAKSDKAKFNIVANPMTEKALKMFRHNDGDGRIYKRWKNKDGSIHKTYLDKQPGSKVLSWWSDIPSFMTASASKERRKYRTQKPLKLLKRIIEASTNEGGCSFRPVLRMRAGGSGGASIEAQVCRH